MAPRDGDRKRKLEDLQDRVGELAARQEEHGQRLDRLDLALEREVAYRHLRVEGSKGLEALFKQVEDGGMDRGQIRARAARVLVEEVREAVESPADEAHLQETAQSLSNRKRACPTVEARMAAARAFGTVESQGLVEWVQPGNRGSFSVWLAAGEPSRVAFEGVRKELNWVLFVLARAKVGPGTQIYPDRGPATAHGKGSGQRPWQRQGGRRVGGATRRGQRRGQRWSRD